MFNDGSVRDYQFKSPQWTSGKNFDGSGPFGPDFVTADEWPPGGKGLKLYTRLNVPGGAGSHDRRPALPIDELVSTASEVFTLEPATSS